ncbi:MAG: hypothetical protein KC621_00870 [Myxococcales bacterium]|nr:hypothetical protein [Myxococcales bacterium]
MDLVATSDTSLAPLDTRASTGWIPLVRAASSALVAGVAPARWLRSTAAPCRACSLGSDGRSDPVVRGLHHCSRRTAELLVGQRPRIETYGGAGWIPTPFATALDRVRQTSADRVGLIVDGATSDESLRVARLAADAGARVAVEHLHRDRASLRTLERITGVGAGTVGYDALAAAELVLVWGEVTATPMIGRWLASAARRGVTVVAVVDGQRPWWAQHVVPTAHPLAVARGTLAGLRGRDAVDQGFLAAHTTGAPAWDAPPEPPPDLHAGVVGWLVGLVAGTRAIVSVGSGWSEELTRALLSLHLSRGAIGRRDAGLLPLPRTPNALGAAAAGLLALDPPSPGDVELLLRVPAGPVTHPDGHTVTAADRRVRLVPPDPDGAHDGFVDWVALARALGAEIPWSRPAEARSAPSLRRPGDQVQVGGPWLHDGGRFATPDGRAALADA